MTKQIVTEEFAAWIDTTSFAGRVRPGEQWDTADAWPSAETMRAARSAYSRFAEGDLERAEELMHDAQRPYV